MGKQQSASGTPCKPGCRQDSAAFGFQALNKGVKDVRLVILPNRRGVVFPTTKPSTSKGESLYCPQSCLAGPSVWSVDCGVTGEDRDVGVVVELGFWWAFDLT